MWESLTHENVQELLSLLSGISEASNTSVMKLIQALKEHPSAIDTRSLSAAPAANDPAAGTVEPMKTRSKKAVTCCRNGRKVVEIRKAPPIAGTKGSPSEFDLEVGHEGKTANSESEDSVDYGSSYSEGEKGKAKGASGLRQNKPAREEKMGKGKGKGKANNSKLKRKTDLAGDEAKGNPRKKWKTDGQPPVVNANAEALIFELGKIGERHRHQDFADFLTALGSSCLTRAQSSINQLDDFPALVNECSLGQTKSAVNDFFHMISLVRLAIFIDRQVISGQAFRTDL
jgi:hypothetical protein